MRSFTHLLTTAASLLLLFHSQDTLASNADASCSQEPPSSNHAGLGPGYCSDKIPGGEALDLHKTSEEFSENNSIEGSTIGLFWTPCQPIKTKHMCPAGYRAIAYGHGKILDAARNELTAEGCHGIGINGYDRAFCAAANVRYEDLQWGPGSISKACKTECPDGWVTLTKTSHVTGQKRGCKDGEYAPLCTHHMRVYSSTFGVC